MDEVSINIAGFFETVMMSEEKINKSIVHNLEMDFKTASQQLKVDFDSLFEDRVKAKASKLLKIIDKISKELDGDKVEQKKYLEEFRKKVLKYVVMPNIIKKEYLDRVFKSIETFQFYMDILYYLNVIDSYGNALDKFQVIAKTIFDNKDFKNSVFVYDLSQKYYFSFLNKKFSKNINPQGVSISVLHIDKVAEYFNDNFKPI